MIEQIKALLVQLLRVPAEPSPPAGAPESIRVFRASRKLYLLNVIVWGVGQVGALIGVAIFFAATWKVNLGQAAVPLRLLEGAAFLFYLAQLPLSYLFVRFDYEMRWYIVTDRSLRIRYGLLHVREMTMTFANIQQITVQQGPLQRLLGIADLQVRTAGGGGSGGPHGESAGGGQMHLGYFRGVDNAPEIRDLMLARLRHWRDSGLGDLDEAMPRTHAAAGSMNSPEALAAARMILEEARALRGACAG